MLESGKKADATFVLGEERIAAHRCVLAMRAPTLAGLCGDADIDGKVEMAGVDFETFKAVPSSSTRTCSSRRRPRPTRGCCSSWPTGSGACL